MAAGRGVAPGLSAVVVAVVLLLAGGADADCFDYCYKNCIANDRSMADYCNYACDKTCEPGAPLRPSISAGGGGGGDMGCQLSCARISCNLLRAGGKALEACFGQCYDGCKTKTLPRPLLAGAGVPTALGAASEPDADDAIRRASWPDEHPFHEKQDAVQPASEPDKDDALRPASGPKVDTSFRPTSEPKDDAVRPASEPGRPFHEKQDSIQPVSEPREASEPDADDAIWLGHWGANPGPEIHAPPPAPAV